MTTYGLKVYNTEGDSRIFTPDEATVIASGTANMPNTLKGDGTYGVDIALGGTYSEDEIGVLVVPSRPSYQVVYQRFIKDATLYYNTFYLDSNETYYTRNDDTHVMSLYSAGNRTANNRSTWNPVLSVFPVAFWDKLGASSFTNIRLFAATAYLFRDTHNEVNFSLAGSASGGGGTGDGVDSVKDDDTVTYYGQGCCANPLGQECDWSYWVQVDLGDPKTITKVELVHRPLAEKAGDAWSSGHYDINLYYGGSWHEIWDFDWSSVYYPCGPDERITTWEYGLWKGVTKIKVTAHGNAHFSSGSGSWACSEHITAELRAWGMNYTDAQENRVAYSLGNKGVETVDYVIYRRKFV